jgi:hypothetical protein
MVEGKIGRGVVSAKPFEQALLDGLNSNFRMVDPARYGEERKRSPLFPRLVEAAYRGEVATEKMARRRSTERDHPWLLASEIAEDRVADAAGISRSMVHQLCQQVHDDFKRAKRRAAAKPGCGVELDPPMTAEQLRRHFRQTKPEAIRQSP